MLQTINLPFNDIVAAEVSSSPLTNHVFLTATYYKPRIEPILEERPSSVL